ncbi:copper amine oxidase N-terminal domain-containing protein [Paenibacillus pini]|uniref:Copper amine oxidase domain protein n=1 Tax=Paenibacillus pini JCM 16418 TaxID=1236976 RepID=W7YN70_9BACL|nr:copper amine oxidase N-terminal domain-containing protein [Paenibacillus pini]GAF09907.1 copper amine oxidase domain protein [Paenibacillus pini JCM 16418]
MNIKKTLLASVMTGSMLFSSIIVASEPTYASSAKQVVIELNGVTQSFKQPALINKGTTLVPMRDVFEKLGAHILWNPETLTIVATKHDTSIEMQLGNKQAYVNGKAVNLGDPIKMVNYTTMVPLRFVSEAFDASVSWNQKQLKASINMK